MAASRVFFVATILAAGAICAAEAPALAQSAGDGATVFGQPMSPRYLVNRLAGPAPQGPDGTPGANGAAAEEDDGPGPFPRRFLFNKLFDSGASPEGAAKTP